MSTIWSLSSGMGNYLFRGQVCDLVKSSSSDLADSGGEYRQISLKDSSLRLGGRVSARFPTELGCALCFYGLNGAVLFVVRSFRTLEFLGPSGELGLSGVLLSYS